ncbi:lysylphosphatidylglycerol synthase transmembrane domain-containing protein [Candidatus Nanohalobium constans]|uniref:Lysylphosphatidylglycerol synthase TM region / glycosyltransferase 2 family protein n=1 Tax=Candidatus Nanohalobium constans TaxID=2565781 RepID=A0A5Q0UEX3_9ARCH|nr:lysylphosphatidylglycerol synthase transmembrane domain-containing protein [Candidatus Nanohalobium constans]QGA80143.1 lysylphosphatidylglycerol synthase TM region / glycosyltransferase 2 family protein [Candidatus Nanohalobium constans]
MLWSLNWYVFFRSLGIECSYAKSFRIFMAGQFFNTVTSLGRFGGQPIMAYLISKKSSSSYEKSLATVMSADLVTVLPMSIFIVTGLSFLLISGSGSDEIATAAVTLLGFLLTGVVIGFLAWFRSGTMEKYGFSAIRKLTEITGRGESYLEKLKSRIDNWEKTLQTIGENPTTLIYSILITASAFLSRMAAFYLILASLNLQMHPLEIMLLIPLISFASISPTPGGSGTYEAAMAASIILLMDISFATALTVTILYRLCTYWQVLTIGYISTTTLGRIPGVDKIAQQPEIKG